MFALALRGCFVHFFKSGALRVAAPAAQANAPFFFLQSFFFWGYLLKRKSVKGILVSIDSGTNYSDCLSFIHFFFGEIRHLFSCLTCVSHLLRKIEKKVPKKKCRAKGCAPLNRATVRGAPLLKKWTKRFNWCCANSPLNSNLSIN